MEAYDDTMTNVHCMGNQPIHLDKDPHFGHTINTQPLLLCSEGQLLHIYTKRSWQLRKLHASIKIPLDKF